MYTRWMMISPRSKSDAFSELKLESFAICLSPRRKLYTLKKIISQTDKYFVILSSKTYGFEDKLTKYESVWLILISQTD